MHHLSSHFAVRSDNNAFDNMIPIVKYKCCVNSCKIYGNFSFHIGKIITVIDIGFIVYSVGVSTSQCIIKIRSWIEFNLI